MKNNAPKIMTHADPPIAATFCTLAAQGLPAPPATRVARSRDHTAIVARMDTVIAVPIAIVNVANMPAHRMPRLKLNSKTPMAPVQGRMPIENANDQACDQFQGPCS